nr:ubiquinone biosynthesis O-methyltransferase, mitochondrial isoform X1 [Leptinotarsa decemlineata]XP_023021918.1 ubiquinone biosynthesis O-methyltransferase, mitochondrial isoform X1 [Leptinotarsa decemlineata]
MLTRSITARKNCIRFLATATNTVDQQEVQQFQKFVEGWWDEFGPMKALHSMNKLRVPLIRDGLVNSGLVQKKRIDSPLPLEGLSILDIGCGGGILSEPLARLGGIITGIDANLEIVTVARSHADLNHLDINYVTSSIEDHALGNAEKYDAVVASEIIEHVSQKSAFIEACAKCLKPNGSIFVTTLSKTRLADFVAVFLAEDVARLVPKGTHQYEKFIKPHELQRLLEDNNCRTELVHGMFYNVVTNTWHWCSNTSVNFALQATKLEKVEDCD